MVLLLAVWWAWVYTTWATNWLNPDSTACRLMLIGVMGVGLVMATSIPDAFGDGGLTFAVAYAAIQVGRSSLVLWAVRADVTAVGDELVIAHPIGQADVATLATVLGGPALFLAGHALFRYTVIGVRSGSRLVAIALLVGLIPVANRVVAARHRAGGDAGGGRRAIHESVFHPASTAESISVEGA